MPTADRNYDITGRIGDLFPIQKPEWPMYSFGRPSYMLWNAIAAGLSASGWSEDQIKEWLQSKATRWALDGDLGDDIRKLGEAYAEKIAGEKIP